jgi:hypothetical protein
MTPQTIQFIYSINYLNRKIGVMALFSTENMLEKMCLEY